jgi:ABC-type transporter Mla MlaB component
MNSLLTNGTLALAGPLERDAMPSVVVFVWGSQRHRYSALCAVDGAGGGDAARVKLSYVVIVI